MTLTAPDPPEGVTAVIKVGDTTLKDPASIPPNFTEVTVTKLLPLMVTVVPATDAAGLNELITGGGMNINPCKVFHPVGLITFTLPDAPVLTEAVIVVELTMLKPDAGTPPKLTDVAPVKLIPVIVMIVPGPPLVGLNE